MFWKRGRLRTKPNPEIGLIRCPAVSCGFRLADHGFLEASNVKLALTLQNTGDSLITPCGQLMSLFRRARLFASRQLVEDRIELATESSITERLKDGARRINDSIEQHPIASYNNDQYAAIGANKKP